MKKIATICTGLLLLLFASQVAAARLVGVWSGEATMVSQKSKSVDTGKYYTVPVSITITNQKGNRFEATTQWKGKQYKIYGMVNGDSIHASAESAVISGSLVDDNTMDLTAQVTSPNEKLTGSGILKKE